jgi:UDP-galactopyranose mutase
MNQLSLQKVLNLISSNLKYDFVIVGSGFFGSICAHELSKKYKVLVVEKRNLIGGNCYTENVDGIQVHKYGAHIFHTSDKKVWNYVNQFAEFTPFVNSPLANYKGEIYSLPFNMWTFYQLWGTKDEDTVKGKIESQRFKGTVTNLEEQALSMVGSDIYEKLIKGYTEKQWGRKCSDLPASIIKRLPVRFSWNNNYFNDTYQGIPKGGYTQIFEKLLEGIDLHTSVDFFDQKDYYESIGKKIIYTGPIDRFFEYQFGKLDYRSLRWRELKIENDNFQGNPVVNYTDIETPFTRILEHKWFDHQNQKGSIISLEYPQDYTGDNEPYYPVRDEENVMKYQQYKSLADNSEKYIFGGRLGTYNYYDMHQVVAQALTTVQKLL